MAKALLYPTIGLLWEAETFDAELSAAYCRAYNRWIADFCRDSGGRLVPIAHLSLGDPARRRASSSARSKMDARARSSAPFTITRDPHGDPRHDALFAAAQDSTCRSRSIRHFEPLDIRRTSSLRRDGLGGVVLRSVCGAGRAACVRDVFPVRRIRSLPEAAVIVLEAQARMDRLFPRSRRRDLQRHPLGRPCD